MLANDLTGCASKREYPLPLAPIRSLFSFVTVACVRMLRYEMAPSPEDSRYRDSLSPPCSTLVVDNVSPDVSTEEITAIFAKVGMSRDSVFHVHV